ncbi:hypothetical protein [Escherichia coli]|uniref:hypothetical protein n=1 Tax=Escherichia coli TaxID=562 RepID=UPI0020224DA8|nr:hypothetical protein [Escherichia coli]
MLSWQKGTLVGGHDDNDSALDISYMSNGNNIDYGGDKVFAGNYRSVICGTQCWVEQTVAQKPN